MDANSNLTAVPGGQEAQEDLSDVQHTEEGFRQFIAQVLKDKGEAFRSITVEKVLNDKLLAKLRETLVESFQKHINEVNLVKAKKRRELQKLQDEEMVKEAEAFDALLREANGLLPRLTTQEQVRTKVMQSLAAVPATSNQPTKPAVQIEQEDRMRNLRNRIGNTLPEMVYERGDAAVLFRATLKSCIQPYRQKLSERIPDTKYRDELTKRRDEIQKIFPNVDEVVLAWGYRLTDFVINKPLHKEINDIMSTDPRFAKMMKWIGKCPTTEDIKAEADAELKEKADAEAKTATAKAVEEAKQKRRDELKPLLKAQLLKTNPGLGEAAAENLAKAIAKKHSDLVDLRAMFIASANERMDSVENEKDKAKKEKDECDAKVTLDRYLNAAELTWEEFQNQRGRNELIKQCVPADTAPTAPATVQSNKTDRSDPNWGSMAPRPKKGKGDGDKKPKNGRKGRQQKQ